MTYVSSDQQFVSCHTVKLKVTSVCSNPPRSSAYQAGELASVSVCLTPDKTPASPPPAAALPLLPHHCQRSHSPRRCLITHAGIKKPSSYFFFFFNISHPLCFNLSSSLAASCGFGTPNGFGWHLISCAFSLAHLQVPIQAPYLPSDR